MEKFLLSLLCLLTVGFAGQAAEKTIVIQPSDFGRTETKYVTTAFTFTKDNVEFKTNQVNPKDGQIRVNNTGTSAFHLFNTTELPGNVISIKLETDQKTFGTWAVKSGETAFSSAINANDNSSELTTENAGKTGIFTLTSSGKFFGMYITTKGSGTVKFSKITITYDDGTSEGPELEANGLAYPQDAYTATLGEAFESPELTNPNNLPVAYSSSNEDVATVDENGKVELIAKGTTVIKAEFAGNDTYKGGSVSYTLTVSKKLEPVVIPDGYSSYRIVFGDSDADETIAIKENDLRDFIIEGEGYCNSFNLTQVYKGKTGVKLASAKNSGLFTINLNQNGQVKSSQIVITACNWASNSGAYDKSSLKINGSTAQSLTDDMDHYYFDIDENALLETIKIEAEKRMYIKAITVIYADVPAAPAVPEIVCEHEIVDGKLTVKAESTSMNFKKVEGIDIYYRLNGGKDKPATRACEDVAHSSWILHQGEDITLTNNHTLLEYLACNPETGVHSETKTIALEVGPTGVAEIEAAEAGEVRWFDMQGREVKGQPAAGVYVRVANGKATKVVVK